jgi:hypothetical protein
VERGARVELRRRARRGRRTAPVRTRLYRDRQLEASALQGNTASILRRYSRSRPSKGLRRARQRERTRVRSPFRPENVDSFAGYTRFLKTRDPSWKSSSRDGVVPIDSRRTRSGHPPEGHLCGILHTNFREGVKVEVRWVSLHSCSRLRGASLIWAMNGRSTCRLAAGSDTTASDLRAAQALPGPRAGLSSSERSGTPRGACGRGP